MKTKINTTNKMVQQLKQMSFFEQTMMGIAIFVATGGLAGGLLMWRSQEVQAQRIGAVEVRVDKMETNTITLREYVDLKEFLAIQFAETKELIRSTENKLDNHLEKGR